MLINQHAESSKLVLSHLETRDNSAMAYTSADVRESPYEKGTYFVRGKHGEQAWAVGPRYQLLSIIGAGSFSVVCLARDLKHGQLIALKRIQDILRDCENAKRELREVCIMRRLSHPSLVQLRGVFVRPSQTGSFSLQGGQLISSSLDLYIAMDYCNCSDLYSLKGELNAIDVKTIIHQLLTGLSYLHLNGVVHRDVKSGNVLVALEGGKRIVKLCDFGSARSLQTLERDGGLKTALSNLLSPDRENALVKKPLGLEKILMSQDRLNEAAAGSNRGARRGEGGLGSNMTSLICTPSYRAPEVIMSKGHYTTKVDLWGLGCILGELLRRVPILGGSIAPSLTVAPVFAVSSDIYDMVPTPDDDDVFAPINIEPTPKGQQQTHGSGCNSRRSLTHREIEAVFDIIGTPPWFSIEAIESHQWKHYLSRTPLRSAALHRIFSSHDAEAVDLLSRFLTFDPRTRCSADEALTHEYFDDIREQRPGSNLMVDRVSSVDQMEVAIGGGVVKEADADGESSFIEHFYDIKDPALALSTLEAELSRAAAEEKQGKGSKEKGSTSGSLRGFLRALIERECLEHAKEEEAREKDALLHPPPSSSIPIISRNASYSSLGSSSSPTPFSLQPPDAFLVVGRHGEWSGALEPSKPSSGPCWGVSLTLRGESEIEADPEMMEAIKRQHQR